MKKDPSLSTLTFDQSEGELSKSINNNSGSSDLENNSDNDLGKRVRELRLARDLTIRALALQSGLSANALSMIENGKTSPSVSTIQQIARAMNIPLVDFFREEKNEKHVVYVRNAHRPTVHIDSTSLENLGEDLAGRAIEPLVVTLQPGASSGRTPIVHTGYEFVYCLSGRILYTVSNESYLLEPGDSVVFESDLPHQWQNINDGHSQFILVLVPIATKVRPTEAHFSADV